MIKLELELDDVREKPAWWGSDYWATPWSVVREFEAEFGQFDLDPCCTVETAKASAYFTIKEDGLRQPWHGKVWCNPPYSQKEKWLRKAATEAAERGCLVVVLLPANTDAAWFHDLVLGKAELRFLRGRIRFIGWKGTPIEQPRNGSLAAIFRPGSNHIGA